MAVFSEKFKPVPKVVVNSCLVLSLNGEPVTRLAALNSQVTGNILGCSFNKNKTLFAALHVATALKDKTKLTGDHNVHNLHCGCVQYNVHVVFKVKSNQ